MRKRAEKVLGDALDEAGRGRKGVAQALSGVAGVFDSLIQKGILASR